MNNDIYLNLAVDLYNNGTWDKETLIRRVTLYAKEKNIDMTAINAFLDRLTKVKEYTIEDKRKILSVIKLGEDELKYGDVVNTMADDMVEKFYNVEENSLGKDRIEKYYELATNTKAGIKQNEEEKKPVVPTIPEPKELTPKDIMIHGDVSLEDIMYGRYTPDDILGMTEKDSDEIFDKLVSSVDKNSFSLVVQNLKGNIGIDYTRKFVEEWSKAHSSEISSDIKEEPKNNGLHAPEPLEDTKEKIPTFHVPKPIIPEAPKVENVVVPPFAGFEHRKEETPVFHVPDSTDLDDEKEGPVVVPSFAELNMPETEEEYKKQEEKFTKPEKDSSVRKVNISPERLAKLKKSKAKVLNFAIKTAIMVAAFALINTPSAMILTVGYMYFANAIKNGEFNPKNSVGKAIKNSVEKVMYIGMTKKEREELEKEGGRTR